MRGAASSLRYGWPMEEKLRLKVAEGNAAGTIIEVEEELTIGRQETGEGALQGDMEMSRRHARIGRAADSGFVIEDLGSTNGTCVNGRRIETETPLETGDRIEVGSSVLVVQVSSPQPAGGEPEEAEGAADPLPDTDAPIKTPVEGTAPDEQPADPLPGFTLRIDVDLEAGRASVALGEGDDRVALVHEDGRWRLK